LFSKQAANSLVTETSQYFVFFCRSVCSANLAKCLIINVLRLIIVILFFIAFLNITYCARHSFITNIMANGANIKTAASLAGHSTTRHTEKYVHIIDELKQKAVDSLPDLTINYK